MSDQSNPHDDLPVDRRNADDSQHEQAPRDGRGNGDRSRDPQRPLSEISHLFLSSIRDRQTGGAQPPRRKPPASNIAPSAPAPGSGDAPREEPPSIPNHSIDLTPEEFAQVYGGGAIQPDENHPDVTAVIAAHLNGRQIDRVREYAAHLALEHNRVGLIELDASEFRLMLFERRLDEVGIDEQEAAIAQPERLDARRMSEALEELNWDVQRWLLLLTAPRTDQARNLLRDVDRWTLLATCDHDGIVSAYRSLKGLADLRTSDGNSTHPALSLALLDVRSHDEADRMTLKLTGVCQQFLNWPVTAEPLVKPAPQVSDHLVLCCRAGREALTGAGPQFAVVHDFLNRSQKPMPEQTLDQSQATVQSIEPPVPMQASSSACVVETATAAATQTSIEASASQPQVSIFINPAASPHVAGKPMNQPSATAQSSFASSGASVVAAPADSAATHGAASRASAIRPDPMADALEAEQTVCDVIDLPGDDTSPATVVSAVLRGSHALAETPLKAPSCPGASLAVSRDRKLVLVAVARQGLADLRNIAMAYRWMTENRPLIAMALPQFSIEPTQSPRLQLLIAQSDASAETLQPLLQSGNVTVQTYRKLRWGGKTGLLLEAA
jgi:hypothetical protein